jgi:RNA polymerase sigma factor (sigma-70 family)
VSTDPPDSQLILASWTRPEEFGEIFRRHYSAVFGFVVGLVGMSHGADMTAEVFVRAFAVRKRYNPDYESARPWLMGIASNLVAGHYRKQAREGRALRRLAIVRPLDGQFDEAAAERVDAFQLGPRLAAAFATLRTEEAKVVSLFVFAGLSYAEIAIALGIPEGTVRSRLNRARTRLRNLMGGWDEHYKNDQHE